MALFASAAGLFHRPFSLPRAGLLALNLLLATAGPVLPAADAPSLNPVPAAAVPTRTRPVVVAHRGDHLGAHENTIEAIEGAIRAGADYVELDVRRTRDGQHVLLHDRTVDRTTDGHGPVAEFSLAEVRALRVVDRQRPSLAPSRIPLLQEALAACRDRIHLYLDFKDGDRAEITRLLRAAGMERRTLVYCGPDEIPGWRTAAPDLPLLVSPPERLATNAVELVRWAREKGVEALDGDWDAYSVEAVRAAEAAGIRVWPDMQGPTEGPEYWAGVTARGFTGLQTDRPAAFIAWAGQHPRPAP